MHGLEHDTASTLHRELTGAQTVHETDTCVEMCQLVKIQIPLNIALSDAVQGAKS